MSNRFIITHADGAARCWWCGDNPLYIAYHDEEWGVPRLWGAGIDDDTRHFEKIVLEGFQAGLSWLTILKKRENFRRAFRGFEIDRVARMGERDVVRLLDDAGIVRHRGKIEAAINNAKRAGALRDERGSLTEFLWSFAPEQESMQSHRTGKTIPSRTPESAAMSKELRRRGWAFVGPTTMYAFMQSVGMVNDHLEGCWRCESAAQARRAWDRERSTVVASPASSAPLRRTRKRP